MISQRYFYKIIPQINTESTVKTNNKKSIVTHNYRRPTILKDFVRSRAHAF